MAECDLSQWRWFLQSEGESALAQTVQLLEHGAEDLRLLSSLRRSYGQERGTAALRQAQLRRRARTKFSEAARMLFTPRGLAQSTSQVIGRYKAGRMGVLPAIDLCCGIGGDLIFLANRGAAQGVDLDPNSAFCAEHNCQVYGAGKVSVICEPAEHFRLDPGAGVHIDPDRRDEGRRTIDLQFFKPGLDAIESILERASRAAVKVAPATQLPEHWYREHEVEWIGHQGECKQQVVWTHDVASRPGCRVATVIAADGERVARIVGSTANPKHGAVESLCQYLIEPHAAVLAAGLTDELAAELGGHRFTPHVGYLTSPRIADSGLAQTFEILDSVPLSRSAVEAAIRSRSETVGELKTRGLAGVDIAAITKLQYQGPSGLTVVLTRVANKPRALICRRIGDAEHLDHHGGLTPLARTSEIQL